MGLMPDIINSINIYGCNGSTEISFETLNTKLDLIMASLQQLSAKVGELNTKVDALQATVDTEQQQISDAIAAQTTLIEQLRQQLTDGGTEAERQAVLDLAETVLGKLNTAQSDIQSTIADTPTEPSEPPATEPGNSEAPTGSGTNTGTGGSTSL